ncbi:uncharacterized protein ARMOST_20252 [Armillaria ostoyae]|uniref:Uncharacterized protein n=1 Tax=Armillaria ostoyae TaxID=47428 RepID=A0A284S6U1_ARMOS|nr:uncharacterized protein ARMOST_20252 [Armillaria ostoyae]
MELRSGVQVRAAQVHPTAFLHSPLPPSNGDIRRTAVQPVARHSGASPRCGGSGNESHIKSVHLRRSFATYSQRLQSICETVQSHLNVLSRLVSSRPDILNDFLAGERTYIEEEDLTIGSGINYR